MRLTTWEVEAGTSKGERIRQSEGLCRILKNKEMEEQFVDDTKVGVREFQQMESPIGFRDYTAIVGSLKGIPPKACVRLCVQLDHDGEPEAMHGNFGALEANRGATEEEKSGSDAILDGHDRVHRKS